MRNGFIKKYNINIYAYFFVLLVLILIGFSYAFFSYNRVGLNKMLITGEVYMHYNESTDTISLKDVLPESNSKARERNDNYISFTVDGKNTSTNNDIYYEILLNHGNDIEGKTRLDDSHLKFDLIETKTINGIVETNTVLSGVSYNELNNRRIWVNTIERNILEEVEITYQLRMWISDSVWISDTDLGADYTMEEYKNSYASIRVSVSGDFEKKEIYKFLYNELETTLEPFLLADDGDARIVSGSQDEILNNYIWYSGKLWRVVALNNDESIKLITENNISTISWGTSKTYTGSWIYQWLNEDFLDTLYNYKNLLVTDYLWNVSMVDGTTKPDKITMEKSPVGLLNIYEYQETYRMASSFSEGYLHNSFYWWTLSPYDNTNIWYANFGYNQAIGNLSGNSKSLGIRPVINLKNVQFIKGDGSESNPFLILGDLLPTIGSLNGRISGEYLNFDNELYRIVEVDNGVTKINKVDYLKNEQGSLLGKKFASTNLFGKDDNEQSDTYWDYYLNNTWYESIDAKYKEMLVKGNWYTSSITSTAKSYKNSICLNDNTSQTVKECNKSNNYYVNYVGIGRIGEFFSSHINVNKNGKSMWLINSSSTSYIWYIPIDGAANSKGLLNIGTNCVRPSLFLSANVKIVSGNGTKEYPFEISL